MIWLLAAALGQTPAVESADAILTRVAENQERGQEGRSKYVYQQEVFGRLIRGSGKVSREERRVFVVTPTATGYQKDMKMFSGRYEKGGKYYEYQQPGFQYKDTDIDGDLIDDLINDLTDEKKSRDGFDADLFPLRKEKIGEYKFRLLETKEHQGRRAHRIRFEPKDKQDFGWQGEAWIDAAEFEPLSIQTSLSRGIPMAVKVLLGTNLKQLGFSVEYRRVAPGIWFPVSYGTEFHIRVLFGYARTVTLALKNSDFRAVDVESTITYKTDPDK